MFIKKLNLKKSFILGGLALILVIAGCGGGTDGTEYNEFAQCLNDQGLVMYGAFWCPHCHDQKDLFGDSFENVNYVECDPNDPDGQPELCLAKGIESYPTWIRESDGERWLGVRTLEQLAQTSTCELPAPSL